MLRDPSLAPLYDTFLTSGDADALLAGRTSAVDRVVIDTFAACGVQHGGAALLAVGGYGRRELFPHSDVDLLLLHPTGPLDAAERAVVSAFQQRLWDAGLRISHSVRTVADCTELHDQNVELNISLLDQRFLAGDAALHGQLTERLPRFIHSQRENLVRNLAALTATRHEKFNRTMYHLEPNIKEAPGGLRDLQIAGWLSDIKSQERQGPIARTEALPEDMEAARQFLFALRCYLHFHNERDANVLSFEAQEWVAERTGHGSTETYMREFFRHARAIRRGSARQLESAHSTSASLFSQFRDWRSRLSNAEFTVARERVFLKAPSLLDQDPEIVLRLFAFVARHGIRLAHDTQDRIASRIEHFAAYFSESRPLWDRFEEMLSLPYGHLALRLMHEINLLSAIFSEWKEIDCLVIQDFYHRYTVDEHTLVTLHELSRLAKADGVALPPEIRAYGEIYSETEDLAVLMFALLFHDAGKSDHGRGHVDASLAAVEGPMERIQMPEEKRELVRFLIGRHLDLSAAINGRDLEDPATAEFVAHRVGTVERLKALTLLTFADISSVNPGAMTPWRASQLLRLYVITYNELTKELDSERIESAAADSPEKAAFLEGLPTRYLRTHSPAEIAAHFALALRSRERGVALDLLKIGGVYRLTVIAPDRPFLFSSIAGALASFAMNIVKAEAFANRRAEVVDTFTFADPARTLELNPQEIDRLKSAIDRVVLGKTDVKQLLRNRPRPTLPARRAAFEPSVSFDNGISASATLIQIVAEDRPGLLYDLSSAISSESGNIEVILIDTEAHRAIDVFYVTVNGKKLNEHQQMALRAGLVEACRT